VTRNFLLFLSCLLAITDTFASPFGLTYTYPFYTKDPNHLHGFRAAINYQPLSLIGSHWQIYFDAGYSHWWINAGSPHNNLSNYSIAPYFRYYFFKKPTLSPYAEVSIGLSYLTKTHLDDHNLGMHFAFQDQMGLGVAVGQNQRLFTTLGFLHYSNGSMCRMNAGI